MTLHLHLHIQRCILVSPDGDVENASWLTRELIKFEPTGDGMVKVTAPRWHLRERRLV